MRYEFQKQSPDHEVLKQNPKETSPTVLFFLSVFHNIATLKFMSNEKF